jgi:rhomboid family GlyGly-CTERM serine protease
MGLHQDRNNSGKTILRCIRGWRFPAVLILASGMLEFFGDGARTLLQYDRLAIADGEVWRLICGQFVHLGMSHYLLNAVGLILVWLLVGRQFTTMQWLVVTAASIAGVNTGIWIFHPEIIWYVGMSGFLHGMLAAGGVIGLKTAPGEALLIGGAVLIKLAYEQGFGPLPGSEQSAGGHVLVDAHLYGALAGLVAAAVFWLGIPSKSPTQE